MELIQFLMKSVNKILFLLFFTSVFMGCGAEEKGSIDANQKALPANILGQWDGHLFNESTGVTRNLQLTVTRAVIFSKRVSNGTPDGAVEISGDIVLGGHLCFENIETSFFFQRVDGNEVKISLFRRTSVGDINLVGRVEGNRMTGNFEISGGICSGHKGTWTVFNPNPPIESFKNLFGPPLKALGEWEGAWFNHIFNSNLKFSIDFISVTQDTPLNMVSASGFITISSTPCSIEKVQGFVEPISENDFSIKARGIDDLKVLGPSGGDVRFMGKMENNKIEGYFEVIRTPDSQDLVGCLSDIGFWEVSRSSL